MKRLIYFLLSILGFGAVSCDGSNDVCMYGVPTAKYVVNARVVDPEGNPIKGIEVVVSEGEDFEDESARLLETTTNDDGTLVENITHGWPLIKLYVRFTDVDGEENGGDFQSVTITPQDMVEESRFDDMPPRGTLKEYKATIKLKKK